MRALHFRFGSWCVVVALAIAITAVGFAHRSVSTVMSAELAAYVAAGGQLSDICSLGDGEGDPARVECEACLISDTFVHLRMHRVNYTETKQTCTFAFVAKRIAERSNLDPARLTRAPPQA